MVNFLRLSVVDHKADDFIDWFNMLEQGLYSTSSMGTEFGPSGTALMTDASTMELRVDYVTIAGQVHATGVSGYFDEVEIHFTATFTNPEPLGFPVWTDMRPLSLFDDLLGDTRIFGFGKGGDDQAVGLDFNDLFNLKNGNDMAFGGDGNDLLQGGRGMDLLIGGGDRDRLIGGDDADMLLVGSGNDVANGGSGNDVMVFDGGINTARGGTGIDLFLFDSVASSAGTNPQGLRTVVRDLDAGDLLMFAGLGVSPDTIDPSSETLDDLANGTVDDFRWRELNGNVVIDAGDARVVLRDTTADEVDLDHVIFTTRTALETASLFDGTADDVALGRNGSGAVTLDGTGASSFIAYGADVTGFIAFGTDGTGFITFGDGAGI